MSSVYSHAKSDIVWFISPGNIPSRSDQGFTLVEVIAALFLLVLISNGVLAIFTTSDVWIGRARQDSVASGYAAAVMEAVRGYAVDLKDMGIDSDNTYQVSDPNTSDKAFIWVINGKTVNLSAPEGMLATITISRFDDSSYYDCVSGGIPQIDSNDVYFYNNLFMVQVDIAYGTDSAYCYSLSTIMGAR